VTSANLTDWFHTLVRPPGAPPDAVFAPVWTALYIAMGVAAWLVWRRVGAGAALRLWGWQLAVNALWPPAFFGLHAPVLGLAVLALLIVLVVLTIRAFAPIHRLATGLLLPYLAWCCYAAYLNTGFWWLNRG
jgi:benzodiazapine receptor